MKSKRKNDETPRLYTRKVLLRMLLAVIASLAILLIISYVILSVVSQQVRSSLGLDSAATGDIAREYVEAILRAPLPASVTDVEYDSFGFLDTYDANFYFSLPPADYEIYATRARPNCVLLPLKEGSQDMQPDCFRLTSMTLTIDRSDPALWRVHFAVHGSA